MKTMNRTMLPITSIRCIFGIGIIEYPIGRPRPILSVVCSIVIFLIYLGFLRMANLSDIVKFHGSLIAANNYRMICYSCTAFVAISIYLTHMKAKVVYDSQQKLDVLNDRLGILGIPTDCQTNCQTIIIQMIAVFGYILILMILDYKYVGFDLPSEWSRVCFLTISHHLLMFSYIVDSSFIAGTRYFGNRFQHLNTFLAKSASSKESIPSISHKSDDQFKLYSSVIGEIHQNNQMAIRAAEKHWLLYVIRETRIIHHRLCKTATEMNRAFGMQALLSVALSVRLITALLYTTYIIATTSSLSVLLNGNWMAKMIVPLYIMFYATKVFLFVAATEFTSCEANRTKELISKLRESIACDGDIHDEIDLFSLQLLQNPLHLTAHGFFPLNYSLVHGIIGSVTTYLIIMIQMQNTYESQQANSTPNSTMLMLTNGTY